MGMGVLFHLVLVLLHEDTWVLSVSMSRALPVALEVVASFRRNPSVKMQDPRHTQTQTQT